MEIRKVGVVGCGLMGGGIAQVCAQSGFATVVREVSRELLDKGMAGIESRLAKDVAKGKLIPHAKDAAMSLLTPTTDLDAFADCQIVIEAIVENLDAKRDLYTALDAICPAETIFASNTSSLTIIEMAAVTKRPARFAGLHFFNPVPIMKLVEVVRSIATSDETIATLKQFGLALGKTVVEAKDTPGFIVNRLLVPYLLDAVRVLESGIATREDIDEGMKLGCGYPIGPLALLDFVGLDTTFYIANIMFEEFKEPRFAPPPLLKRMVLAGQLGRKSGKGFYKYDGAAAEGRSISGSAGASAQALGIAATLDAWQVQMQSWIDAQPNISPEDKQDAKEQIRKIRAEAGKGAQADPRRLEKLLNILVVIGPDIFEVAVTTLANPFAGIGLTLKKIRDHARLERAAT
jgi:3-hydroxybutyryl-CoA dehydrogenase